MTGESRSLQQGAGSNFVGLRERKAKNRGADRKSVPTTALRGPKTGAGQGGQSFPYLLEI